VFSNVTIFHILKNEKYELFFSAGFFIDKIMTGKNYDRKKRYSKSEPVQLCGCVGFFVMVPAKSELLPRQSAGK
jgi:hypothetical protein